MALLWMISTTTTCLLSLFHQLWCGIQWLMESCASCVTPLTSGYVFTASLPPSKEKASEPTLGLLCEDCWSDHWLLPCNYLAEESLVLQWEMGPAWWNHNIGLWPFVELSWCSVWVILPTDLWTSASNFLSGVGCAMDGNLSVKISININSKTLHDTPKKDALIHCVQIAFSRLNPQGFDIDYNQGRLEFWMSSCVTKCYSLDIELFVERATRQYKHLYLDEEFK